MKNNLHYPLQQDLVLEIQKRIYTAILEIESDSKGIMSVRCELESIAQDISHIVATYYFEDDLLLLLFKFLNFSKAYIEYLGEFCVTKQYRMSA